MTIVGEGARKAGENVAACFFLGPAAFNLDALDVHLDRKRLRELWEEAEDNPGKTLLFCMFLAQVIAEKQAEGRNPDVRVAGNGCSAQRVGIRGQMRKGKLSLTPVKAPSGVKYGCSAAANGALKLTTRGDLREQLGRKFDLGVLRRPDAPATGGRLIFVFRMIN